MIILLHYAVRSYVVAFAYKCAVQNSANRHTLSGYITLMIIFASKPLSSFDHILSTDSVAVLVISDHIPSTDRVAVWVSFDNILSKDIVEV